MAKTKIFFSNNVEPSLSQSISEWSGYTKTINLGKCLGVPLFHNQVSTLTYSYVFEKVLSRWKVEKSSMA